MRSLAALVLCLEAGVAAAAGAARADEPTGPRPPSEPGATPSGSEVQRLRSDLSELERRLERQEKLREEDAAASDLAALEKSAAVSLLPEEPKLQLYGFMDFGLQRYFVDADTQPGIFPTDKTTFVSGNTNLYIDVTPVPVFRGLIEVRFTSLPHGNYTLDTESLGVTPRQNNRIYDLTSPSGRNVIQWGSIILERAQVEWHPLDSFRVIGGQFLTPWGIWYVDHGTPTLISLILPSFLLDDAVPQRLTGVQVLGSLFSRFGELGYAAHVSNGRSATLFDLSDDKALGGRVFFRRPGSTRLTLGASGFMGRTQDQSRQYGVAPDLSVFVERRTLYAFAERALGVDVALDRGGLRVRAEAMIRHVRYDDDKPEPALGVPGATVPNHYEQFGYIIVAHRVGLAEPYVYLEGKDTEARQAFLPDRSLTASVGCNLIFYRSAQIKLQYARLVYQNRSGEYNYSSLVSRFVLAF